VLYLLRKGLLKPALLDEKGEYSLMCVLLFPPIPEGVTEMKPRGDTKQRTIFFAFWAGPFVLQSVRRELFSTLKSSGSDSIFMKGVETCYETKTRILTNNKKELSAGL